MTMTMRWARESFAVMPCHMSTEDRGHTPAPFGHSHGENTLEGSGLRASGTCRTPYALAWWLASRIARIWQCRAALAERPLPEPDGHQLFTFERIFTMGRGRARRRKQKVRLPALPKYIRYFPNFLRDRGPAGYLTTGHEAEARRELSEKRPGRLALMFVRLLGGRR